MVEGDVFREVEEEMRKERMKALWDRFGTYIIGGALAIIVGVTGVKGWEYYKTTQANEAGARFEGALVFELDDKKNEARAVLEKLAADGPLGYRALASLRMAGDLAAEGKKPEAVAAYEKVAAIEGLNASLVSFATVRAAMLRVDEANWDEMNTRLSGLTGGQNSWRHSARELLGLSAYRTGKRAEAEKVFQEILVDSDSPRGLRNRAQVMLGLLVEPVSAAKSTASSGDDASDDNAAAAQN